MRRMNRANTASARAHTYLLLSRLYLEGVTDDLLPYIAEIPELAAAAPRPFDRDQAAAAHYQIFTHDIFPYESIFRDPSGLLGGDYADQVRATYKNAGIRITVDCDHIGHELTYLAALCSAESSKLSSPNDDAAGHFEQLQATFLGEHLLYWLPPLVTSMHYADQPFYGTVGQLTQGIIYDHLLTLTHTNLLDRLSIPDASNIPDIPDILQNDQTSLKQIAGFLITAPYSGLYLSRNTISDLARSHELPRGFGSRQQMLSNLFHTAAQYDLVPDVLQDLAAHAGSWGNYYKSQMADFTEMREWIGPWLKRANGTADLLSKMRALSIATP